MEWGEPPADSAVVVKLAMPELFKVPMPRLMAPSLKTTIPVGMPPLPLTVAVKVTPLPASAGFCEDVTDVVLGPIDGAADSTKTVAE
jgi:hypothetical protein